MNRAQHFATRQQGAALIVALIVMALVSVLGLSALRSSMFSGKVATSVQADAMTYEAAETAINVTYNELDEMSDSDITINLGDGDVYLGCVRNGSGNFGSTCGNNDRLDVRELLQARSSSFKCGLSHVSGSSLRLGMVEHHVCIIGEGEFLTLNLENFHYLETVKLGLAPLQN